MIFFIDLPQSSPKLHLIKDAIIAKNLRHFYCFIYRNFAIIYIDMMRCKKYFERTYLREESVGAEVLSAIYRNKLHTHKKG